MVEPITINVRHLSQDVRLPQEQVQAAIDLLDAGFPVPFIARYRKEVTRNLGEEALRQIEEELRAARALCERKQVILRATEATGKLTHSFDKNIREAKSVKRLEDLYLPFKPKRHQLAAAARENGLEPFALEVLEGTLPADKVDERAAEFINEDKKVKSVADVLLGAGHIIADIFSCKAELVQKVREIIYQHGHLTTTKIVKPGEKKETAGGRRQTAEELHAELPSELQSEDRGSDSLESAQETVEDRRQKANRRKDNRRQTVNRRSDARRRVAEDRRQTVVETADDKRQTQEKAAVGRRQTADRRGDDRRQTTEDRRQTTDDRRRVVADNWQTMEEMADGRRQTVEEEIHQDESSEEMAAEGIPNEKIADESTESEEESSAVCRLPSVVSTPEDEVTALFEQHQAAQAEKGVPKIISQNTLKKKKRAEEKKKLDEIKQRQKEHFERQFAEYFDYSVKLRGILAHRILSFNRGERHKVINVAINIDEAKLLETVKEICVTPDHIHADFLKGCLQDALHRGVVPAMIREIREEMTEYAEKNAIKIFGQNLRHLLLQRPLPQKRILALEPSGKTGCKIVALDEFGNLIGHETIFFSGNADRRENAEKVLAEMIRKFNVSVIAIGIGGGSRVAEEFIAHMIETHFSDSDVSYIMVNKVGSVSYATSPAAKEEFPNEDTVVRATVSIGRRLQNPLNELVKIEPANLGLGSFHLDIRGKHLKQMLDEVVESCVNFVGVDVNAASSAHLTHVAGLNPMTARRIYEYRREHGVFRTREDLKKVPGIGATVYTHSAGFLRIIGGDNPLDSTNIHPESYELAANIIEKLGFSVNDLRSSEKMKAVSDKIASERIGELTVKFTSQFNAGINTVRDILEILSRFGRDPRDSQPPLVFRKSVLKLDSLTPGMELMGTILNVADFGAFVDIGLAEPGFIHISQMSTEYVQSAHEKVAIGNTLRLWVVEADVTKKRVSLSLLPPGTEKRPPHSGEKERERPPRDQSRDQSRDQTRERAPRPPRPPRPEGERREFSSDKPHGDRPSRDAHGDSRRDSRDGKRFDRKPFDRSPRTFVTTPVKKEAKPITEKMKQGKEPMRSFSDLAQLFGRDSSGENDGDKSQRAGSKK